MWQLNLSRGGYRLLLWIKDRNKRNTIIWKRTKWASKAQEDLEYTQPMISMCMKELCNNGLVEKIDGGWKVLWLP